MSVTVRPARESDLAPAQELVVRSINTLTERHGFGPMASVRPTVFQSFSLRDDPAGLWVAEDGNGLVGSVFSWVCGDLWFLAELFVAPGRQGAGIGNALLGHALEHARKAGATKKALITFAFNSVSQGLYIRHGMVPRLPLFMLSGSLPDKITPLGPPYLHGIPLRATHLDRIAQLDQSAIGVTRDKHHLLLLSDREMTGWLFAADGGETVGYAYMSSSGHIGPAAVARPEILQSVFVSLLGLAMLGNKQRLSILVPGTTEALLTMALQHGLRITFPMVLACTPGFGDWTTYLPRNPGFM